MRVRNLCLLMLLFLLAGGLVCEPDLSPTPSPTTTSGPLPTRAPMPTPRPPVTLRWNLERDPESLDPVHTDWGNGMDVARQLFLGLTAYDPKTSEPIPDLATHWDASESGQVYTFYLRADVQWVYRDLATDRVVALRPVTAHDVVYGLRRTIDPETGSDYAYLLYAIQNAELINTEPPTHTVESLGVTALDDRTVRFTMEQPGAYLPAILALPPAWPVPREAIEADGKRWTEPEAIFVNGPYVLTEWVHDERLTLDKNPLYHDATGVQIERVECIVADEPHWTDKMTPSLAAYVDGKIDTIRVSSEELDPALKSQLAFSPVACTYYYVFNTYKSPFDDVHVRRAFSYAIDREALVKIVLRDGSKPANTLAPPGIFGNVAGDPTAGISFDPEKARSELARAGYPHGRGLAEIKLGYRSSETDVLVAQAIAAMWQEHLNVEVSAYSWPPPPLLQSYDQFFSSLPHMGRDGWCCDYLDQYDFIHQVVSTDVRWGYSFHSLQLVSDPSESQQLNAVLTAASVELDPARRKALYREAEQLLCVDICAVAPIFYYTQAWLTKPYLHRDYTAAGEQNFKDWRIDPH